MWREQLSTVNEKAGQSLADPKDYDNLFPGLQDALKTQQYLKAERATFLPARAAATLTPNWDRNPVQEMNNAENSGDFFYNEPVTGIPKEDLEETKYVILQKNVLL